eukprot:10184856-Ditylum_brightwellii.AAC.1
MVHKKSSPQKKNQTPVAKQGDLKVKVLMNNVKDSSAAVLMPVINGSIDVGVVDDKGKKRSPDKCVPPFDPNEMLQNKNIQ